MSTLVRTVTGCLPWWWLLQGISLVDSIHTVSICRPSNTNLIESDWVSVTAFSVIQMTEIKSQYPPPFPPHSLSTLATHRYTNQMRIVGTDRAEIKTVRRYAEGWLYMNLLTDINKCGPIQTHLSNSNEITTRQKNRPGLWLKQKKVQIKMRWIKKKKGLSLCAARYLPLRAEILSFTAMVGIL